MPVPRVLFLCTGNSCRSQMAEGWCRHLHPGRFDASSAGTVAKGLDPRAVRAMAEAAIDISGHGSKTAASLLEAGERFDLVVTVCGDAHEHCPIFPDAPRVLHQGFDDPPRLVAGIADQATAMVAYRRVRDEIRAFVARLPGILEEGRT